VTVDPVLDEATQILGDNIDRFCLRELPAAALRTDAH
jgi:hypothetical protein